MKHIHAAEGYANRPHKEIETVFTKFNRASYLNLNFNSNFYFNFKIEISGAVDNLA
jgi:hypothetical protein